MRERPPRVRKSIVGNDSEALSAMGSAKTPAKKAAAIETGRKRREENEKKRARAEEERIAYEHEEPRRDAIRAAKELRENTPNRDITYTNSEGDVIDFDDLAT